MLFGRGDTRTPAAGQAKRPVLLLQFDAVSYYRMEYKEKARLWGEQPGLSVNGLVENATYQSRLMLK